jgi:effector-binding domain-containing protein
MKTLKYIFYIVLGLAALVGGLGLFAKKTYHIERSMVIDAPKALVYDQIRLFKNFHEWSPWSKLDPDMKLTYAGNDGEVGSSYAWVGNDDVGEGKQTLKSLAPDRLELQLDFVKPFESSIPVFYNITGDEEKTKVTWGFDPYLPFPINVWAMFTDIDKAMGTDYERGLGFLKRRCEGMAHKKYHGYEVAEEEIPDTYYLCMRKEIAIADFSTFYAENLPKLMEVVNTEKLTLAGSPSALYWTYDEKAGTTDMAAAIPMKESKKNAKDFQVFKIDGGKALVIDFLGDYSSIMEAHLAMDEYMTSNNLHNIPPVIESYVTDPETEPDTTKWLTKVIYFVEPMPDSTKVKK